MADGLLCSRELRFILDGLIRHFQGVFLSTHRGVFQLGVLPGYFRWSILQKEFVIASVGHENAVRGSEGQGRGGFGGWSRVEVGQR